MPDIKKVIPDIGGTQVTVNTIWAEYDKLRKANAPVNIPSQLPPGPVTNTAMGYSPTLTGSLKDPIPHEDWPVSNQKCLVPVGEWLDTEDTGSDLENAIDHERQQTNPTVLKVNAWERSRGIQHAKKLSGYDDLLRQPDLDQDGALSLTHDTAADFYSACFQEDPQICDNPPQNTRKEFIEKLLESPEFQQTRKQTRLRDEVSGMMLPEMINAYGLYLQKRNEIPKDSPHRKTELQMAAQSSVDSVNEALEEYTETCRVFGNGPGDGADPVEAAKLRGAYDMIHKCPFLKKIMRIAGSYCRAAMSRQRIKTDYGYDDMVDIVTDDDIPKILSSELVRLLDPALEMEALERISSKKALARKYRGIEKVKKGPIIVCVDESSSMSSHDNIYKAKAISLAMYNIAKHQKRALLLIGFSGASQINICSVTDHTDDKYTDVLNWMLHFYYGGTNFDAPLTHILTKDVVLEPDGKVQSIQWDKLERADTIFITDDEGSLSDKTIKWWNHLRATTGMRGIGVVVSSKPVKPVLEQIMDVVYYASSLDLDENFIPSCFSV